MSDPQRRSAVSAAIAAARIRSGLSQQELASITGIDQARISRLERGEANPSLQTLERIAAGTKTRLRVEFEQSDCDD